MLRPHDSRRRSNGSTPPARRQLIEGAETEPHLRRRAEVGPEPEELEQEWTCLIDFVSGRAQLLLDDELVEVAASSPGGHDIDKLPQDLQGVARRNERLRAASRNARSKRES